MRKILFPLLLFIMAVACKQKTTKSAADVEKDMKEIIEKSPGINAGDGTYNIEAPEGWQKKDTVFMGMKATFLTSAAEGPNDTFTENVNVVTEKVNDMSMDDYVDANLSVMSSRMTDFEKISSGNVFINKRECRRLVYSHNYTGVPIDVEAYILVNNGIGYVITCSTLKGKLNQWKPEFDKAVNTFVIK